MISRKFAAIVGILVVAGVVSPLVIRLVERQEASDQYITDALNFEARLNSAAPRAPAFRLRARPPAYELHENMGRLRIERLHLSVPVVEGADDAGLKLGAAHVLGTGYPGTQMNCAVAAHRDTLFRSLKDIRKGDVITFTTKLASFEYQVTGMEIISPENTAVLSSRGTPEMTLVTCYPFYFVGHAPKRYIVHATLSKS